MNADEIRLRTNRNMERLELYLSKTLPTHIKEQAAEVVADYLIENALRPYNEYRYASRAEAYGMDGAGGDWTYKRKGKVYTMNPVPGYFSARQFHYVMAKIKLFPPGIPHRSGALGQGWMIEKDTGMEGSVRVLIVNRTKGAGFVMSASRQARQPMLAGWINDMDRIDAHADAAVKEMASWIQADIVTNLGAGK